MKECMPEMWSLDYRHCYVIISQHMFMKPVPIDQLNSVVWHCYKQYLNDDWVEIILEVPNFRDLSSLSLFMNLLSTSSKSSSMSCSMCGT
jgi:hypothetical protein